MHGLLAKTLIFVKRDLLLEVKNLPYEKSSVTNLTVTITDSRSYQLPCWYNVPAAI